METDTKSRNAGGKRLGTDKTTIADALRNELMGKGAVLVGYGDISEIPSEIRAGFPVGICVAVKYSKNVIRGISDSPTKAYAEQYDELNILLDSLVNYGAEFLIQHGYRALAQNRSWVERHETDYASQLPHKTIATRAGIGWIGKCALLVTKKYGSMIRISTLLTDAPLPVAEPVNSSYCGNCSVCQQACPARAVSGKNWDVSLQRDDFWNAVACRKTARERSYRSVGKEMALCGKCIEICPFTRRYLKESLLLV
jgi:epoxyqueuosine reductase QueG